jgi:Tfp pilus assembly protein PilF
VRSLIASALQPAIVSIAVVRRPRVSVLLLLIGCLSGSSMSGRAQEPSAQAGLATGIGQTRAGDFRRALITLSDVIIQVSGEPDASATLARVHAYRAWAFIGVDEPQRAQASAMLALGIDPNIVVDASDYGPKVVALFRDARRPFAENPEAVGRQAEQAGRPQEAFLAYLFAFQALPEPPVPADDQRLREKIIGAVQKLSVKPMIPRTARAHVAKADDLLRAEAILGGATSVAAQQAAAAELRQAIRIAPWWTDATFQLATVLQKLQRVDEALLNLNLYKLADPAGYTAAANRAIPTKAGTASIDPEPRAVAPAVIYVYFPHAARAMGVKPKLLCDGQHVANLANNRFIKLTAAPGSHNFELKGRTANATFTGGLEHYIRVGIEGYPAHAALRLTDPAEATAEMLEKKVSSNDPAQTFGTECKPAGGIPKRKGR